MGLAQSESQKKALREKARYNARRNAVALSNHCANSKRVGKKYEAECALIEKESD
jgi:hypothetical protein